MSKWSGFQASRRQFFIQALQGAAMTVTGMLLPACSTLDEYLIEDQFDFDQEVIIIGGGIAGLYAAYELKKNKIPFKIFEASDRLGGKIQTVDNTEWGAFEFHKNDEILNKLATEFNLAKTTLDSKTWAFTQGASAFVSEITEIVQGLIPERQIRLGYRLSSIKKMGSRYQLIFQSPQKERMYFARKVILALPQQTLLKLNNLSTIDEVKPLLAVLEKSKKWTQIRVNIPLSSVNMSYRQNDKIQFSIIENTFYKMTSIQSAQLSIVPWAGQLVMTFRMNQDHPLRPIQHLEGFIQKITSSNFVLDSDTCKDWGDLTDSRPNQPLDEIIQWPNQNLKIVSEAFIPVSEQPNFKANRSSVEGLLQLVAKEVQSFKLDLERI